MPKISYIVPVYNAEKTLLRCVESLLYGDETDCEILLSEDFSSDGSWELCLQLQQQFPQIRAIRNVDNSGVSHTRNRALEEATGEYILFVDSDDWVCKEYAKTLLSAAEEHTDAMVVCGFRFKEQVQGYEQDFLWDDSGVQKVYIEKAQFFDLYNKTLLQQLWNKVFIRRVIEEAHVRFDESQSMGEDFEFVLAYMKAIGCERYVMINQPLYSYIRATANSLMGKFGLVENEDEYARLKKLHELTGCETTEPYERALESAKNSYVYHAVRAKTFSKREKIAFIEKIKGKEQAKSVYRKQRLLFWKEQTVGFYKQSKVLVSRVKNRGYRELNRFKIRKMRQRLQTEQITLFSQNCIAGVFYHDMGMVFQSPTINLYFEAPDFMKFVRDPQQYAGMELQMTWGLDYPLGTLGDITIHFMHYDTCKQARSAWERRLTRVDWNRILVLSTDMEGFDDEVFEQWKAVSHPKVLFTANPRYAKAAGSVFYPHYQQHGCVSDLIPKREFYKNNVLLNTVNAIEK